MPKHITKLSHIEQDRQNANVGTERGRYMVEASLRETGAGRSIVVDREGRVIAGNKTVEVWGEISDPEDVVVIKTTGDKLVIVQRDDLDLANDERARKLAYYDNRAGEVGLEWDAEQILSDLNAGLDLDSMFRQDEIDELLADLQEPPTEGDTEPQIDRADELRQEWGVETGQLWQLGEHRLICGDCMDADVVARVMDGEKASLTVTSPPYPDAEMWEASAAELIALGNAVIQNTFSFTAAGGVLCWNTADVPRGNDGMAPNTARDTMTAYDAGWIKRGDIVWWKGMSYLPLPSFTRRPTIPNCTHESLLVFFKGDWSPRDVKGGLSGDAMEWNRESVWKISTESAKAMGHKAPFPLELPMRCITLWSLDTDLIHDPFLGSGTTLIACENLNRRCRAIEISPAYVAVALQRWQDHTGKTPVLIDDLG